MRGGLLALTAVLVVAACSPGTPAQDEGPRRPRAGGDELVVEVAALDVPLVLDAVPAGMRVTEAVLGSPPDSYPPALATLYGDPDLPDTLDGPVVFVGRSSGSANTAGPRVDASARQEVDLGSRSGWLAHAGDRTWVTFDVEGQDYVEFVVARGLSDAEVLTAARTATFGEVSQLDADMLPDGLEALVQATPTDGPMWYRNPGLFVRLDSDTATVFVTAVRADPRLAAFWGSWIEDPTGTSVRGSAGSDGSLNGSSQLSSSRGVVWAEDGYVIAVGGSTPEVEQVIAALRPGTAADVEALGRSRVETAPTATELGCPADSGVVSDLDGDLRWVFALGRMGEGWVTCLDVLLAGLGSQGGLSGDFGLRPVGRLSANTYGSGGVPPTPEGTIVAGSAPPGTSRVTVRGPDGVLRDAVLAETGPRSGERVFGAWVPGSPPSQTRQFEVTAYDAADRQLDRTRV